MYIFKGLVCLALVLCCVGMPQYRRSPISQPIADTTTLGARIINTAIRSVMLLRASIEATNYENEQVITTKLNGYNFHVTYTPIGGTMNENMFNTLVSTLLDSNSPVRQVASHMVAMVLSDDGAHIARLDYDYISYDESRSQPYNETLQTAVGPVNTTDLSAFRKGFVNAEIKHYNITVAPDSRSIDYGPSIANRPRYGNGHAVMYMCLGADTLSMDQFMHAGDKRYSRRGAYLAVTSSLDLCLYGPDDKVYWCSDLVTKVAKPHKGYHLTTEGFLCLYNQHYAACYQHTRPASWAYRLTIQNDGNLVLYNYEYNALFSSGTWVYPYTGPVACDDPNVTSESYVSVIPNKAATDGFVLRSCSMTSPSQCDYRSLVSAGNKFRLIVQRDGNLVIHDGVKNIWSLKSRALPDGDYRGVMQDDGNFCIRDASGANKQCTHTTPYPKGRYAMVIEPIGHVYIVNSKGSTIWGSWFQQELK